MKSLNSATVLGALVADSASLGLHWVYDPARIAEIEPVRGIVFLQPDPSNYSGIKGYFAHRLKVAGDSSSYGETCLLMLKHLAQHGKVFRGAEHAAPRRSQFPPVAAVPGKVAGSLIRRARRCWDRRRRPPRRRPCRRRRFSI